MTTVGEILLSARLKKKLTLEQVEKATRIRAKFLAAIEKNDFRQLPPTTFVKGFIKNYANFLGLPTEEILAFYRRQIDETLPPAFSKPQTFSPGQNLISRLSLTGLGVIILLILFTAYLAFSYFRLAGAPILILSSPAQNSTIAVEQIDVTGKTDPDATIMINNQPVNIDQNGSFLVKITLQPGLNTLTVVATNKFKRQTTVTRNIRLEK